MKFKTLSPVAKQLFLFALSCAFLVACDKNDADNTFGNSAGPDVNLYAITQDNRLLQLNAMNTATITATVSITGLQTGESLLGIDFRPATGELYGIGSTNRIYVINLKTGAARAINATPFMPAIDGTSIGFDFNPTVDRIRLVTSNNQDLRLNPETGMVVATDGAINGVSNAKIGSVAYTQNKAGAATTTLFDIDFVNDKLHKQDPPNNGTLVEVGSLGYDVDEAGGFDISPAGQAIAAMTLKSNSRSALFTIDVSTGKATKVGDLNVVVTGIAIPTEPVAYAIGSNNDPLIFNPLNPTVVSKSITGLQSGESLLGIDFRPVNGQLFAIGTTSRLYTINASSGAAAMVGMGPLATAISGTDFGFDFNPTVDRIRLVSNTGQNLRLNPNDGTIAATDGALSPGTPVVNGAAYTNNFAGATTTVLYDIDAQSDKLYKQDPPNNGTLVEVGGLGINIESANGFDIGGSSGLAYGVFTVGGMTKIYTVNLISGTATAGETMTQSVRGFTLGLGF